MKIYLIRHGQSQANVDPLLYAQLKDHNVPLTDLGKEQSYKAGADLAPKLKKNKPVAVFVSPYKRTRETWNEIKQHLSGYDLREEENPLLREQEYKIFADLKEAEEKYGHQKAFGHFWYRYKNAESTADVHQRVQVFINMLMLRKLSKKLPEQIVIVAHEITIRTILMIIHNIKVEDSNLKINNCEIVEIDNKQVRYF